MLVPRINIISFNHVSAVVSNFVARRQGSASRTTAKHAQFSAKMWAGASRVRPAMPAARPCAVRASAALRVPQVQRHTAPSVSLPSFHPSSRSSLFPRLPARAFSTDATPPPAPSTPTAAPETKRDPREFPDISPITGNKKPPGMWREMWFGGEDTMWISAPIPVTKHLKRNPYQWKRLLERKRLKLRDATPRKPGQILLSNHTVQLITTGKPLNDRRKLTFKIPIKMSKITLRQYLGKLYGLDVAKVNTLNVEGKWKRRMDGDGRYQIFKEPNWKKAYVTLRTELQPAATPEAKPAAEAKATA